MSDAFITRRDGGIKDSFALIDATYPAGSVCTCTNGSKTLRAKDTSGSFLFMIPEAGTWTVSCTDGTRTKSKSVVISSKYQEEKITLSYEFVLFSKETGLASGYTLSSPATIDANDELYVSFNADRGGGIAINEPITTQLIENYSTLTVLTGSNVSGTYQLLGLRSSFSPSSTYDGYSGQDYVVVYSSVESGYVQPNTTYTFDISNIDIPTYFKFGMYAYGGRRSVSIASIIFS